MSSTRRHSVETGIVLVVLGLLFLLDNLGIADLGDVIATWWPLLLVGLGVWIILESRKRSSAEPSGQTPDVHRDAAVLDGDQIVETRVFGDINVRLSSPSFRKGSVHASFGSVAVDLNGLQPADAHARLALNAIFGQVRLRVPRSLPVHLVARATFGKVRVGGQETAGFNSVLTHRSSDFDEAPRRLTVVANTLFGDVIVDFSGDAR